MLPSEKIELAIYKFVNQLGPGRVSVSLPHLSQQIGENDQWRIIERLKGLEAENRIVLPNYSGGQPWPCGDSPDQTFFGSGSFLIEITPKGRKYFEQLESVAAAEARNANKVTANTGLIFVSCGQATEAERALGKGATVLVTEETGGQAYFAQNQSSLEGLTENILKKTAPDGWIHRSNAPARRRFESYEAL